MTLRRLRKQIESVLSNNVNIEWDLAYPGCEFVSTASTGSSETLTCENLNKMWALCNSNAYAAQVEDLYVKPEDKRRISSFGSREGRTSRARNGIHNCPPNTLDLGPGPETFKKPTPVQQARRDYYWAIIDFHRELNPEIFRDIPEGEAHTMECLLERIRNK